MSPEPFISCAKTPPGKRSEKGYGDENALRSTTADHVIIITDQFMQLDIDHAQDPDVK